MTKMIGLSLSFAFLLSAAVAVPPDDPDTDGDGLSDFRERHKHFTDPAKADSDGDGTPDGDWLERREYTYTVRSIVQVLRPVTPEYLIDDYQDARVLDESDEHVELEVIHYPFNTVAETISGNPNWRRESARGGDRRDLATGVTYRVRARNAREGFTWQIEETIERG